MSGTHPGPLDYLILGLAAVGFVAVLGLVAFAFEPHYREARTRLCGGLRRVLRNELIWRGHQDEDAPLGRLPSTWRRDQGRVRRAIERIRRGR